MMRVEVRPELLRWARERAGFDLSDLAQRIPQLPAWERGEARPTLKQIERFAKTTHTPIGFLFLQEPPIEHVPIPDLRTAGNERIEHPSPHLLDTIYICQQRQEWYRGFARSVREEPFPFVGSVRLVSSTHAMRRPLENRARRLEEGLKRAQEMARLAPPDPEEIEEMEEDERERLEEMIEAVTLAGSAEQVRTAGRRGPARLLLALCRHRLRHDAAPSGAGS